MQEKSHYEIFPLFTRKLPIYIFIHKVIMTSFNISTNYKLNIEKLKRKKKQDKSNNNLFPYTSSHRPPTEFCNVN